MMKRPIPTSAIILIATIVLLTTTPLVYARTPHQPIAESKATLSAQCTTMHSISPLFPSFREIVFQLQLPWFKGGQTANPIHFKPVTPEKPGELDGGESGFIRNGGL